MKSIRDIGSTKNKLRNKVIMFSLALGLLVVVSTNAISPLELVKPAMAAKKLISTDDIADNAVTSPKIKAGEVKTSDIADGTITGDDVSTGFMIRKTLNDDAAGHTHNWNPEGLSRHFSISDDDITGDENSLLISIMVNDLGGTDPPVCSVRAINTVTGFWHFSCDHAPIDGSKLDYIITKLPANVATSSLSVSPSSTSSSTLTISSPFSSLGGH